MILDWETASSYKINNISGVSIEGFRYDSSFGWAFEGIRASLCAAVEPVAQTPKIGPARRPTL